jgi:hypothetical protein
MLSSEYLRRQAALCLRIAAAVDDQSVVAALVVMADDFSVKADEIDPDIDPSLGSSRQAAMPRVAIAACAVDNKSATG